MSITILGSVILIAYTIWIHFSPYPVDPQPQETPRRDAVEVLILVLILLAVPFFSLNLLWFSGWLGVYLLVGILLPLILEGFLRRRPLSAIGFRPPENQRILMITGSLLTIYLVSRLAQPGFFSQFSWRRFFTNSILFAGMEEVLFRGLIQTCLRSFLGKVGGWVGSGVFFGFYHYYVHYLTQQKTPSLEEALSLVFITSLGLLLGVIFAKTKSLLPSFLIHMANNL